MSEIQQRIARALYPHSALVEQVGSEAGYWDAKCSCGWRYTHHGEYHLFEDWSDAWVTHNRHVAEVLVSKLELTWPD